MHLSLVISLLKGAGVVTVSPFQATNHISAGARLVVTQPIRSLLRSFVDSDKPGAGDTFS